MHGACRNQSLATFQDHVLQVPREVAIVPWLRDRDVTGAAHPAGAVMKSCAALGTNVGTVILVPRPMLDAT